MNNKFIDKPNTWYAHYAARKIQSRSGGLQTNILGKVVK